MYVHHIGYLVKKLEKARTQFTALGFQVVQDAVYDEFRDIDILFMEKDGYVVELVSPKSERSVVANLIRTYRNTPYHLCYASDAFEEDLAKLEHSGFTGIDAPTPAPALGGRNVCFLLSAQIGIIELIDSRGEELKWH